MVPATPQHPFLATMHLILPRPQWWLLRYVNVPVNMQGRDCSGLTHILVPLPGSLSTPCQDKHLISGPGLANSEKRAHSKWFSGCGQVGHDWLGCIKGQTEDICLGWGQAQRQEFWESRNENSPGERKGYGNSPLCIARWHILLPVKFCLIYFLLSFSFCNII